MLGFERTLYKLGLGEFRAKTFSVFDFMDSLFNRFYEEHAGHKCRNISLNKHM